MIETEAAERFLYALLDADGTLESLVGAKIYPNAAPQDTAYPVLIFQLMSGLDTRGQEHVRQETELEYLVKSITEDHDTLAAHAIAAAADTALDKQILTQNGYRISCHRIAPFAMTEEANGIFYQHSGGRYRVLLRHNFTP